MALLPLILIAVVIACVLWFIKACVLKPNHLAPPRAWLSLRPPIVEYGSNPASFILRARSKYGDVFTVPGPLCLNFVFDPETVRKFFDAPEQELSFVKGVNMFVGHLFPDLINSAAHYEQFTGYIMKGLHQATALNGYRAFLNSEADAELDRIASLPSFDVFSEVCKMIVRLSVRMVFGSYMDRSVYPMFCHDWPLLEEAAFSPATLAAPWLPFGPSARFHKYKNRLYAEIEKAFSKALHNPKPDDDSYVGMIARDHAKELNTPEMRRYLQLHLSSIMFGAHTNSATSIAWLLARLTENDGIMAKVLEEQHLVEEEFGDSWSSEAVGKMVYLEACLKETLRQVSGLIIMRYAEVPIQVGKYVIPKNSIVVVSPKGIHSDGSLFPLPTYFDPTRFFNAPARPQGQFLAFGQGQHRCKGEKIATFEAKIIVGKIVRNFRVQRLSPLNELEPDYAKPSVGLAHPKGKLMFRMEPKTSGCC